MDSKVFPPIPGRLTVHGKVILRSEECNFRYTFLSHSHTNSKLKTEKLLESPVPVISGIKWIDFK